MLRFVLIMIVVVSGACWVFWLFSWFVVLQLVVVLGFGGVLFVFFD